MTAEATSQLLNTVVIGLSSFVLGCQVASIHFRQKLRVLADHVAEQLSVISLLNQKIDDLNDVVDELSEELEK